MGHDAPFRQRAIAHKTRAHTINEGHVLRMSPRWVDAAYKVLALCALAALCLALFGRLGEHARGPAVVQFEDRRPVTATSAGIVSGVAVSQGDVLAIGDLLASLHDDSEQAESLRVEQQFKVALAEYLRDPLDGTRSAEVARWRGERASVRARADERLIRATVGGIVSDLYVSQGDAIEPGDLIAAVRGAQAPPVVVALLPGRYRPLLREGEPLLLELPGFERCPQRAEIVSVGGEVIGPAQALRALGAEATDAISLVGPVVIVRAAIKEGALCDSEGALSYFHGMIGTASVTVRSEPVFIALFPSLRRWWR